MLLRAGERRIEDEGLGFAQRARPQPFKGMIFNELDASIIDDFDGDAAIVSSLERKGQRAVELVEKAFV